MRLIDADAIKFEPDQYNAFAMNGVAFAGRFGGKTAAMVQNALKHMIDNAPTVDAVEVVHGRWIDDGSKHGLLGGMCSQCYCFCRIAKYYEYCPHCME